MKLQTMAVTVPAMRKHPNKVPFKGVLTYVDTPSEQPPSGSKYHCVYLTREAAEEALPSLLGMAVNYKLGWTGHDARRKCGIITEAEIVGKQVRVAGYVFGMDFPEIQAKFVRSSPRLGMSYDISDATVADKETEVWVLTRVTFTGAAILLRERAAYTRTEFRLTK